MFGRRGKLDEEWLAELDFFSGFTTAQLKDIAKLGRTEQVDQGTVFIEQGRFGTSCHVIADGRAALYIGDDFVTTLGEGVMVGEMALVDRRPRNATLVAEGPMVLVTFGVDDFRKLLDTYPDVNQKVTNLLSGRLRENIDR